MKKTIEELQKIEKEFLTVREVAEFLGVSEKTMYRHYKDFPFRFEKMGSRILIPKRAFIEYVMRTR